MILQNIVFSDDICKKNELFFRCERDVTVTDAGMYIPAGGQVSFDTYMNIFDKGKWHELTGIKEVGLEIECRGEGTVRLILMDNGKRKEIAKKQFDFSSERKAVLYSDEDVRSGYLQVEVSAGRDFLLKVLRFVTPERKKNNVDIAAVICTYGKKEEVLSTAERLAGVEDLSLYIVDNKKEIPERKEDRLIVCQNENTGGAGGFAKGLELIRSDKRMEFSHVIFMDDDAYVIPETFVRIFSLLSLLKEEYRGRSIAGRMFLLEEPWVQHTAVEIWNGGDIKHIGGSFDMTRRENLPGLNECRGGQYSGFWFSCVPYSFVKDNDPLQLFLHCDDVEYGLRLGTEPIILNGIQVWHESPLRRGTHIAAYYDIRNSMIVNSLGYDGKTAEKAAAYILKTWRDRFDMYEKNHDCDSENMALLAMEHFLKGPEWVYGVDGGRLHKKLLNTGAAESIGKRPLRLAVKLPYEKVNELRRAGVERASVKRITEVVKNYREYKIYTKT